jgi:hypothetical protein
VEIKLKCQHFIFLFIVNLCFAQSNVTVKLPENKRYVMPFNNVITFLKDKIIFSFYEPESLRKEGVYSLDFSYGIPFLNIKWNDGLTEKLLFLFNDSICYAYNSTGLFFGGTNRSQNGDLWLHDVADKIMASSYLIEGNVSYSPDVFRRGASRPLWVEGVPGHGVHEKLFITARSAFALHISIGYVSYSNPNLYQENSRPKRIRLAVQKRFLFDVDLIDTPNFQTVTLPVSLKADDVLELEILEVYPGTKYDDTCINEIMYDFVPWRP